MHILSSRILNVVTCTLSEFIKNLKFFIFILYFYFITVICPFFVTMCVPLLHYRWQPFDLATFHRLIIIIIIY
jgi:hypothetical protein